MANIPFPTKSRTWGLTTPNSGIFIDDEVNQIYDNFNFLDPLSGVYDHVIKDQTSFEAAIENISGTNYRIKSNIKSLYIKSGSYFPHFITANADFFLRTNNCELIMCEPGAIILFDNSVGMASVHGRLEIQTDGFKAYNLTLKSTRINEQTNGTNAFSKAFYWINADNVSLYDCTSYAGSSGFRASDGSDTIGTIHKTMRLVNCTSLYNSVNGFHFCWQITSANVIDTSTPFTSILLYGYKDCRFLSRCIVKAGPIPTTSNATGFFNCSHLDHCISEGDAVSTGIGVNGFTNCNYLTACESFFHKINGFQSCFHLIDCNASGSISNYGFYFCQDLSGCEASTNINGNFRNCFRLSSCYSLSSGGGAGFYICIQLSACEAWNSAHGFEECRNISASKAWNNAGYGFINCAQGSALEAPSNTLGGYFGNVNFHTVQNIFTCI